MAVKSVPEDKASSLVSEFNILSKLRHPGIIKCFGKDVSDGEFPGETNHDLFLEYAAGGSLSGMIADYGKSGVSGVPERDVKLCTLALLEALSYIHSAGYTHCDIKPDNLLLFPNDDGSCQLKIADFGLAMETPDPDSPATKNFRGTTRYLPPEVIVSGKVSPAMDIWAVGCTVVEMLTGERPFSSVKENPMVMWKIINGGQPEIPECLSEEGKDFIRKCFDHRLPADRLLSHAFVTGRSLKKRRRATPQKQDLHQAFEQALAALGS
ncbi:Mitogen-activated protein kinase kinase kinase 20 [Linum grandiflorum]